MVDIRVWGNNVTAWLISKYVTAIVGILYNRYTNADM